MPPTLIAALSAVTGLSACALIVCGALWLQRARRAMAMVLNEAAAQQIRTAQRLAEALAQVQKQQEHTTHQIRALAEAGLRLKHDVAALQDQLDHGAYDEDWAARTFH